MNVNNYTLLSSSAVTRCFLTFLAIFLIFGFGSIITSYLTDNSLF